MLWVDQRFRYSTECIWSVEVDTSQSIVVSTTIGEIRDSGIHTYEKRQLPGTVVIKPSNIGDTSILNTPTQKNNLLLY